MQIYIPNNNNSILLLSMSEPPDNTLKIKKYSKHRIFVSERSHTMVDTDIDVTATSLVTFERITITNVGD